MGHTEGWHCDRAAASAQRLAHGVIVGELSNKWHEAAELNECLMSKRQGRAEAGTGQTDCHANDDTGQEMCVDGERRKIRPYAGDRNAVVKAGYSVDTGLIEC